MASKSKLTEKQEAFAVTYVSNGGNATQAYLDTYDVKPDTKKSSIWKDAHLLVYHPKIAPRIDELRKLKFNGKVLTIEQRKTILSEMAEMGDTKALDLLNKMEGVYIDKVEHSGKIDVNDISARLLGKAK